ncbi:MAG: alpha/beta fold hydrolase [Gemmatimonadales bacterium]
MPPPEIDLTVYPADCDAFGHLNQAAFLALFERARWEMLGRGPGIGLFTREDAWPAVRKTDIEYHAPAFPADVLRFTQTLVHHGRTSFTMRQSARRVRDDALIASAEFVFVCINREGRPVKVPEGLSAFMTGTGVDPGTVRKVVVNGVSLAVDVRGEGPTILFVHGYPLDHTIWEHQLEHLRGWRRVAPDLRGFGVSDAPDLGYSMATYAADLAALLETLAVERAVICGLSMGGYVAFEMLRTVRERIAGLILVSTRAEADSAEGKRARDTAASLARDKGADAIAEAMLPKLMAPATRLDKPALVRRVRELMTGSPVSGIIGALGAMRDRADSTPLLPALEGLPVLVVAGEDDQITPAAEMKAMAETIPGAVFRTVPNAGHLVPLEQGENTTRLLQEFLDSLP